MCLLSMYDDLILRKDNEYSIKLEFRRVSFEERVENCLDRRDVPMVARQIKINDSLSNLTGGKIGFEEVAVKRNDDAFFPSGKRRDFAIPDAAHAQRNERRNIDAMTPHEEAGDPWR